MRDVDLFVGVASVGNDPNWADGGPEGRYRDYWTSYSFGALSQTAKTRKQVLQRLVPRLKIANRCRLEDRFLIVQGDVRTYKIHLGSGNILMEPNDQYLCIVPTRAPTKQPRKQTLPTLRRRPHPGNYPQQSTTISGRHQDKRPHNPPPSQAEVLTSDSRRVERCELLELWQILPLSLEHLIEHLSGIGTAQGSFERRGRPGP